jgi:anti-sigma regulatory factor (Ser/Thr protein kinase)
MEIAPSTWVLPHSPTAPAMARSQVAQACSDLPGDLLEVTLLLTSDVVTNAVSHGRGDVRMSLDCHDQRLRVEVEDDGPGRPILAQVNLMADSGRGLLLLDALANDWGTLPAGAGGGKRVWFSMRTP